MALPEELKDPELFLTDLERHELRRVFEYLAGYDQKYRLNAALTPKLERRSQIKAHMAKPHAVKLVNPVHGDAMTEEEIAQEYVMLAEECERLQKELAEVQSVPFEDKAVEVDDIRSALRHYGLVLPKRDVAEMVWEVDEECTGRLKWEEFELMCELCLNDPTGLQPARLFHCVQFMMFDREFTGSISVDETMEMLYARYGKHRMEAEMKTLFGDNMGGDKRLTLKEYLAAVALNQEQKIAKTLQRKVSKPGPVRINVESRIDAGNSTLRQSRKKRSEAAEGGR